MQTNEGMMRALAHLAAPQLKSLFLPGPKAGGVHNSRLDHFAARKDAPGDSVGMARVSVGVLGALDIKGVVGEGWVLRKVFLRERERERESADKARPAKGQPTAARRELLWKPTSSFCSVSGSQKNST